ncbi:RluA family pseudouridine synthase [Paenibacillus sp. P96]|uniref:Pseudouridine synthase n=1 Tax=Paenibacillus zeirhizosphaerae TaxID=2987519 RepID=A0ABT9FLQ5_9BACL|nr:RluA family pseudouridine synthase [Paenibacillus sp. P96]MDP4095673.1 RluA family pseudouridine synthase [Paenibacillus sp. P96]
MSWLGGWVKRGIWLEVAPGREVTGSAQKEEAADRWLLEVFGLPEKLWRRLRHEKQIRLAGDRLRLALFPTREFGIEPRWHELTILYEDEFCLVVHKPAGMPVHPDSSDSGGPITLNHAVAAYYEMNSIETAVRHVHRLDNDTTGAVLYAKNEFALLKLDEQMRTKQIGRRYAALVAGRVSSGLRTIDLPIGKDRHDKQRRRVSPSGQSAVTHVELGAYLGTASLVYLTLETGRTHQIRVHLSHEGHPLLGDTLYGGSRSDFGRQALHGQSLTFRHPLTDEIVEVFDPWPEDFQVLYDRLDNKYI